MSIERKSGYMLNKVLLDWKAMGKTKYISFIFFYIVFPISIYLLHKIDPEYYLEYVEAQLVFFMPFFSGWWTLLVMYEYTEGDGCEVLRLGKNIKILDTLVFYFLYLVSLFPIFEYVLHVMPRALIIFPILLGRSILLSGIMYTSSMLSKSVSFGIIINVFLCLFLSR